MTEDIEREGAADVSTLLGLSRETAAATMFVRQAEILRVLGGAEALQEYLERAAATATVDTTADEALTALVALKKDKVGLRRSGSRNPITLAHLRLEEARNALETAEQQFESYQEQRARLAGLSEALLEAESELAGVESHEVERAQRERWRGIADLERQMEAARDLQAQLDSAPYEPEPDSGVIEAITGVLDSLKRLPPIPPDTDEPSAEQIRNELAQLPDPPQGDLEAADAVTTAIGSWRTARSLLLSHQQSEPKLEDPAAAPGPAGAEIETLESEIAGLPNVPEGDLEPAAAVADALDGWSRSAASLETHIEGRPETLLATEPEHIGGSTAEDLEAELAQLPVVPDGDREAADSVSRLLAAWREACAGLAAHTNGRPVRPDAGASTGSLQGPSVADLEAQLSGLPTQPTGDIEPARDAQSAYEAWSRADARVLLHAENRPELGAVVELPAQADELRRLLDDLSAPVPEPAAALVAEVAGQHQQDQPVPGPVPKGPLIGGALVVALGIAILAAVQPIVGGVIVALGLSIMVFGLVKRGKSVPVSAASDPELQKNRTALETQVDAQQRA